MKLVLHVGMSKSGSTALQRGLGQLRDRLLARGCLYPTGAGPLHNHAFLVAAVVPPEKLPRSVRGRYRDRPAQVARDLEKRLAVIAAEIARHRPQVVLMSAQNLFQRLPPGAGSQRLAAALRPLADEIEVVAYLRRPSDFYLASTQQGLRADHRVRPLAAVEYRAPLEGFAAIADRLQVFKYDRALFPGGDVLRHFIERFCPELAGEEPPRLDANVSLSTEALAILAAYRRLHHPDKARRFTEDTELLARGARRRRPGASRQRPLAAAPGGRPGGRRGLGRSSLAARRPRHRVRRHRLRPRGADAAAPAAAADRGHLRPRFDAEVGGGAATRCGISPTRRPARRPRRSGAGPAGSGASPGRRPARGEGREARGEGRAPAAGGLGRAAGARRRLHGAPGYQLPPTSRTLRDETCGILVAPAERSGSSLVCRQPAYQLDPGSLKHPRLRRGPACWPESAPFRL